MKKFFLSLLIIFGVAAILLVSNGIYCDNTIEVNKYELTSEKLKTNLHFVLISDLHNKEFGESNEQLVKKIKEQNPDFIAVCGDLVNRTETDDDIMKTFLFQISEIAPVYCVLGNHELDLSDSIDFAAEYAETGCTLLDNEMSEFVKDGETVRIGGLTKYPYDDDSAPEYDTAERKFWDEFEQGSSENYSILLHHRPERIGEVARGGNVDLVLCGHTHGGQIQIPFLGGLYAPNQGLFPTYDKGEFDFAGTKMIITSGLGNQYPVFRINNCAEICVIDVN